MALSLRPYRRLVTAVVDWLSFNEPIRDLAATLKHKIAYGETDAAWLRSHPGGFRRALHKRRMGIAESYIHIAHALDVASAETRLLALRTLMDLSLHAKTVAMPLNTARVQIDLMKEATKHTENRRRQMELIADFSLASYGNEAVIRRLLNELRLVEVPEEGRRLRELDLGWDGHVHDNLSEGRKTPSQVLLDAFIKGLSRLTLVHYDLTNRPIVSEAMLAGDILGIGVCVGVEFSVGDARQRRHYVYRPPAASAAELFAFLDREQERLAPFTAGLAENRARRRATVLGLLTHFNREHLATFNEDVAPDGPFALHALTEDELQRAAPYGPYSRLQLAELLFARYAQVLRRRVLALKVQAGVYRQLSRTGKMTGWEVERIEQRYRAARTALCELSPQSLRSAFFSDSSAEDYDSAFRNEAEVLPPLRALGGDITFVHPLAHGLPAAVNTLVHNAHAIDQVEVVNMHDAASRNPEENVAFCSFVQILNGGSREQAERFLEDQQIAAPAPDALQAALTACQERPLVPVAGSDATGREPSIPGMGFIREASIPRKCRRAYARTHYRLPAPIAAAITGVDGRQPDAPETGPEHCVYSMGKSRPRRPNLVGDEVHFERVGVRRLWRYLNPRAKQGLRVAAGAVPAYLAVGPLFTLIWLGITFVRNVFADLIAASGLQLRLWRVRDINLDNASQSLFWTGFSVPLLAAVKLGFDWAWPGDTEGLAFEGSKFFFLCFANGSYIALHNTLRRFDRQVIRANFFRSVLAWPFAALCAPLGNWAGVPSIVQTKFWSDVVAAVIEGSAKFRQRIVLRRRDLAELLPRIDAPERSVRLTAMLDILYIWARQQRGRTALALLLSPRSQRAAARQAARSATAAAPLLGEPCLQRLLDAFQPHRAQATLTTFVMETYEPREAILLTTLLQERLVPFHQWLKTFRGAWARAARPPDGA